MSKSTLIALAVGALFTTIIRSGSQLISAEYGVIEFACFCVGVLFGAVFMRKERPNETL